jgi:hypothetical protein
MSRSSLTLLLAVALLLLPGLCSGGVLLHPCECGETVACEHEAACESDPCEIGMLRVDSAAQGLEQECPAAALLPMAVAARASDPSSRGASSTLPPTGIGRPFPPSDLPLLI